MDMELVVEKFIERDGKDIVSYFFQPSHVARLTFLQLKRLAQRSLYVDVAIIGIGIHPFGRTDGATGLDQGVFAARQALRGCRR